MEKTDNLLVYRYISDWSDLGGWQAVWQAGEPNENGTVIFGNSTSIDCQNSLLRSEDQNLELVGIGLENIAVIAMSDAVLVIDKSRCQEVKLAVDVLKTKKASQAENLPIDHRPWGWFESLAMGERFQVKRIQVNPGASLSLQSHYHRSEHWIVVSGTAEVVIDDHTQLVTENESVYVPLGKKHRMSNPGKVPMVLVEVQTGTYLGEDDIIRFEDIYSRN
jgi:mannose-1-phosphate guanylyltransferase/mannose-6-phosphate isomerase